MQYASMASSIVNAPVKNEDEKGRMIRELKVSFWLFELRQQTKKRLETESSTRARAYIGK